MNHDPYVVQDFDEDLGTAHRGQTFSPKHYHHSHSQDPNSRNQLSPRNQQYSSRGQSSRPHNVPGIQIPTEQCSKGDRCPANREAHYHTPRGGTYKVGDHPTRFYESYQSQNSPRDPHKSRIPAYHEPCSKGDRCSGSHNAHYHTPRGGTYPIGSQHSPRAQRSPPGRHRLGAQHSYEPCPRGLDCPGSRGPHYHTPWGGTYSLESKYSRGDQYYQGDRYHPEGHTSQSRSPPRAPHYSRIQQPSQPCQKAQCGGSYGPHYHTPKGSIHSWGKVYSPEKYQQNYDHGQRSPGGRPYLGAHYEPENERGRNNQTGDQTRKDPGVTILLEAKNTSMINTLRDNQNLQAVDLI